MTDESTGRNTPQDGEPPGSDAAGTLLAAQQDTGEGLPTRPLGTTGERVSILCLGGWHIGQCGKVDGEPEAIGMMHEAIDEGLTFFDNAWDYHDGYAEELMGRAIADRREQVFLMTKNCERDYDGTLSNLHDSLKRLQTDHIDLWQFHEINYDNDPRWVFEQGGLKAALEAQAAGKIRYIGFTGHKDPRIHLEMIGQPYDWDTVQMPINICDYFYRSFQKQVVPVCLEHGIGVIGMKTLAGSPGGTSGAIPEAGLATAEECIQYSLSQPVSSQVLGIRIRRDLDQALRVGRGFRPLDEDRLATLRDGVREAAGDGRVELFKSTQHFDGPHHQKQHGFAVEETP
jgi:predicted aldo/keto reductase-like oxidoreductase